MSKETPNSQEGDLPESSKGAEEGTSESGEHSRTVLVSVAVLTISLVAFGFGRWTGGAGVGTSGGAETVSSSGSGASTSKQYTCPMHPDVRSDSPDDTCPICGMDLVPMDETDGGDESSIPSLELSDRAIEVATIRPQKVDRRPLRREVETYGRVEVAEASETDITSWVRGRIEHLDIRARGQRIRRGQRIARLYSPKLESVQKELLQALETAEQASDESGSSARQRSAQSAVDAARSRLRVLGMREKQIDAIAESREVREVVDVYAERSGTIRERHAFEGDWVDVGDAIASLHGLDTVWVQLDIYERDLPFVEEGMPVTLTFPNRPDVERKGRIAFIDPVIDPKDGTARARVVVSNENGRLPPGTDVRAEIEASLEGDSPPLSVPESAVLWTGKRSVAYRYDRSGQNPAFVPVEVELGPKADGRRVIRKGLSEGDEVAVHGTFRIDAELQIQGESSMMTGLPPSQRLADSIEVPEDGKEFEPGIPPDKVPEGVWYCPMDPSHWAQGKQGNGECPICGMNLKQKGDSGGGNGHDHSHGDDSTPDGSNEERSSPIEVPDEGKEFDPGIPPDKVPEGVWYCPMDPSHWAQGEEGDGECPICGMNLEEKGSSQGEGAHGHDHGGGQ